MYAATTIPSLISERVCVNISLLAVGKMYLAIVFHCHKVVKASFLPLIQGRATMHFTICMLSINDGIIYICVI